MSDHIAEHLAPERCFICGKDKHPNTAAAGGHQFFANADAQQEAEKADRRTRVTYSNGLICKQFMVGS